MCSYIPCVVRLEVEGITRRSGSARQQASTDYHSHVNLLLISPQLRALLSHKDMLKFVKSKIHPKNERSLEKNGKNLHKRENVLQEIWKSKFQCLKPGANYNKTFFWQINTQFKCKLQHKGRVERMGTSISPKDL